MKQVIVLNPFVNIYTMQVCAPDDAIEEEILQACNQNNPAGTTNGWTTVVYNDPEHPQCEPVVCADNDGRKHYLVRC